MLALERADIPGAWQLPQGGLRAGEAVDAAAWRELSEETGLGPKHVVLEDHWELWVGYELPEEYRKPKTGRGQVHRWFLFRAHGVELPELPPNSEFQAHEWLAMGKLISSAVSFRQAQYRAVASWLGHRVAQ